MPPAQQTTERLRVAATADLDAAGGILPVLVEGVPWVIVRLGESLTAFRDRCPHRRVPLSRGRVVPTDTGPALECPYHGWSFDASGACTRIPALGPHAAVPKGMRVAAARVTEEDGALWLAFEGTATCG